jgi:hypothetical protein
MRRATLTLLALTLAFATTAGSASAANNTPAGHVARVSATASAASAEVAAGIGVVNAMSDEHFKNDFSQFGVRVVPGSRINLVSSESRLPIKIRNDYDSDVRVFVWTQPDALWITMPKATEVTVPAMTTTTALVPIEAISNGDTSIRVYLSSFTGVRMGESNWVEIHVERDIEPAILGGFIVVVGALGIIGGRRMMRRRRGASE